MKIVTFCSLVANVLNIVGFMALAAIGISRGVSDPFPYWFRNGSEICFFGALALLLLSVLCLVSPSHRVRSFISAALAGATAMVIAFLTTRG